MQLPVDQGFDGALDIVVQLESIGTEELDAVILERIVRRRDHNP